MAALLTGFWIYHRYDGRWGRLSLPEIPDLIGLHGTFGLFFLCLLPLLALYSFYLGPHRLLDRRSLDQLRQGSALAWHRAASTAMLFAAVFAVISGRQMQEAWLPAGELFHVWYRLHLVAWLGVAIALLAHVGLAWRAGGIALLLSMGRWTARSGDRPRNWLAQIRSHFRPATPPSRSVARSDRRDPVIRLA